MKIWSHPVLLVHLQVVQKRYMPQMISCQNLPVAMMLAQSTLVRRIIPRKWLLVTRPILCELIILHFPAWKNCTAVSTSIKNQNLHHHADWDPWSSFDYYCCLTCSLLICCIMWGYIIVTLSSIASCLKIQVCLSYCCFRYPDLKPPSSPSPNAPVSSTSNEMLPSIADKLGNWHKPARIKAIPLWPFTRQIRCRLQMRSINSNDPIYGTEATLRQSRVIEKKIIVKLYMLLGWEDH